MMGKCLDKQSNFVSKEGFYENGKRWAAAENEEGTKCRKQELEHNAQTQHYLHRLLGALLSNLAGDLVRFQQTGDVRSYEMQYGLSGRRMGLQNGVCFAKRMERVCTCATICCFLQCHLH